ncbi:MAG: hypothetical protein JWP35_1671 [Caulobacter sp.]|nr:hypothetical protein [Caulobacter sp.]
MGKARALSALASLASQALHRAYIDGATVNHYLLPDELAEDVRSALFWMTHAANRAALSQREIERFSKLVAVIDENFDEAAPQLGFTTRGPVAAIEAWNRIQQAASQTLAAFGIRAEDLSLEDIEGEDADWPSRAHWDIT